ncbi:unnamed protein product [Pelagomonas calceolata]|uniref:SET domain-containing protein n=1 Tax=Pelagomonas calceolata TaxID=35677 RepID=A0A8J2S513_9STRA|nr:unnamed protein product [Pelagomonas calceolata]|mmetsp:Transcript_6280/g.17695  ORF Transcript_6280/g.17695 Transcript_6280/m.17695 type:complete len:391 (-) Transcript_6280:4163-5335(-)
MLRWLRLSCAALVIERAAPLNPLRRLLRRPPPVTDQIYESWSVDVEAYERADPRVTLQESPGAGTGVFAAQDLKEGSTATEYVGLLAECPDTRSGDLALYQSYYGENWRKYCQRYEIGLTGARVADAVGRAKGGSVVAGSLKTTCNVDEDLDACVTRAGEGEYVLLGKVERATVDEGVAQLINDHSTIRAPSHLTPSEGSLRPSDVDGFVLKDPAWPYPPVAVDGAALRRATQEYVSNIESSTNCALVQATIGSSGLFAPRIFAVCTRDIKKGEELRLTYGAEWWLAQLRRAALAQVVSCAPSPRRAAALEAMIRAVEDVSVDARDAQAAACARAGCMPRAFVQPLERMAPLDELLADDSWQKILLAEEFLGAECVVDEIYADAFQPTLK